MPEPAKWDEGYFKFPEGIETQFEDVMNAKDPPNILKEGGDPKDPRDHQFNIDYVGDPTKPYDWDTADIQLGLPHAEKPTPDCFQTCREIQKERALRCAKFRERVALAMKKAGCPSVIRPIKQKSPCGGGSSKKSTAKKPAASTRRRR